MLSLSAPENVELIILYSKSTFMTDSPFPIVLISGTNRPNSTTRKITRYYQSILEGYGAQTLTLDLADLPHDFTVSALYHNTGKNEAFNELQHITTQAEKFVFIVPEYNGSYPGVLKAFIDGLPYPNAFPNKKAALVGISSNMHGASSALSHLNDVFSYLGMHTVALRVKLAQIRQNFSNEQITNDLYNDLLHLQARQLISF